MPKAKRPVMDRLLDRISLADSGCWIYPTTTDSGYGVIGLGGRGGATAKTHRVAYEHISGPIPDGMDLDHLCRVRACCNPAHLEPVTRQTNLLRGARKTEQTHCKSGHEFNAVNTRTSTGRRVCRACERDRGVAYRARKRATA